LEKTSSPFISLVLKIQRRSSNPTITRSRRWSSYLRSFHLSLLVKQNVYHLPCLNISHVPLAIQAITFVPWRCPKHQLWSPRGRIPHTSMKTSLSILLLIHAHFWGL
jgi:hypothetical protein